MHSLPRYIYISLSRSLFRSLSLVRSFRPQSFCHPPRQVYTYNVKRTHGMRNVGAREKSSANGKGNAKNSGARETNESNARRCVSRSRKSRFSAIDPRSRQGSKQARKPHARSRSLVLSLSHTHTHFLLSLSFSLYIVERVD